MTNRLLFERNSLLNSEAAVHDAKRKTFIEKYAKFITTLLLFMLFLCIFLMIVTVVLALRLFRAETKSDISLDQSRIIAYDSADSATLRSDLSTSPVSYTVVPASLLTATNEYDSNFESTTSDFKDAESPKSLVQESTSQNPISTTLLLQPEGTVSSSDPTPEEDSNIKTSGDKNNEVTATSPTPITCPTLSSKPDDQTTSAATTTTWLPTSTIPTRPKNSTCFVISQSEGWKEASLNIRKSMDVLADPCENFHQYACGVWAMRNPLTDGVNSRTQYSFVRQATLNDTREAIESIDIATSPLAMIKLKTAYDICMNPTRSELGGSALKRIFNWGELGNWPLISSSWGSSGSRPERLLSKLMKDYGLETVLTANVHPYPMNSSDIVLELKGNENYAKKKIHHSKYNEYIEIISEVGKKLSWDLASYPRGSITKKDFRTPIKRDVQNVVNLEQKLAEIAGNVDKSMDKFNVSQLQSQFPNFDWNRFFLELLPEEFLESRYTSAFQVHVGSPKFLLQLTDLIHNTNRRVLQNYFIWSLIRESLPFLSSKYRELHERIQNLASGHSRPPREKWENCIRHFKYGSPAGTLGYAIGRAYVNKHFTSVVKYDVRHIATDIARAFTDMVQSSPWMDPETKFHAKEKIRTMKIHVGHPDWILDNVALDNFYSGLEIKTGSLLHVMNSIKSWAFRKNLERLLMPRDHADFGGAPSETNAWHNAPGNSVTLPAGEIRSPFYGLTYPQAVNYGAIGYVIGHEMAHGFDTSGSMYDSNGNLHDWWSENSRKAFLNKTSCMLKEYSQFCYPSLDLCVDGSKTEREDSADIAGLKAAYIAFKKYSREGKDHKSLPGLESFSQDQIFFLSFASFWCGQTRDEALKRQLLHYGYTPDKYRVLGTLRNLPEFAQAFQCPVGSFMNPSDRCDLW